MRNPSPQPTTLFSEDIKLRDRTVSTVVLHECIAIEAPPNKVLLDWDRDISQQLMLSAGDVGSLSMARTRARWRDYKNSIQTTLKWARHFKLESAFVDCIPTLMACLGARYHHDTDRYGDKVFCNIFLSEDKGLDVHFSATGLRVPLKRGTVIVFDPSQPHGVVYRDKHLFEDGDYSSAFQCSQIFLTWELPVDNPKVCSALNITFDTDYSSALTVQNSQLWLNGQEIKVCSQSGKWLKSD